LNKTLIVTDMDGTLLNGQERISEENLRAIKAFMEAGGLFTLATGRAEKSVMPYVRELGVQLPLILYNGARIVHPETLDILYEKQLTVPPALWNELLERIDSGLELLVYLGRDVFPLSAESWTKRIAEGKFDKPVLEFGEKNVAKLVAVSASHERLEEMKRLIQESGMPCTLVYSEPTLLEILPQGASKGDALKELVRMLQIDGLRTIALGDYLNDVEMLKWADNGIAVSNAHPQLKEVADEITVHHEQHAVATVIFEKTGLKVS